MTTDLPTEAPRRRRSQASALASLRTKAQRATDADTALEDAIWDARQAGASLRAMANVLGVSHVAVHQRLRRMTEDRIAEGLADLEAGRVAMYDPAPGTEEGDD
jgi:hypothetical protein